jgi:hypothetical protein
LKGVDRESRALACIKVVFYRTGLGGGPPFDLTTAEALATLQDDNSAVISHHAACTAAKVACQLQSDIVQSLLDRRYIGSLAHYCEALDRLGIFQFALNSFGGDVLRSQLACFSGPSRDELDDIWAFMQHKTGQIMQLCQPLPPDELRHLDNLEPHPSKGKLLTQCLPYGKVAPSRGHIVTFVSPVSPEHISHSCGRTGIRFGNSPVCSR